MPPPESLTTIVMVEFGGTSVGGAVQAAVTDLALENDIAFLGQLAGVGGIERTGDVGEILRRSSLSILAVVVELGVEEVLHPVGGLRNLAVVVDVGDRVRVLVPHGARRSPAVELVAVDANAVEVMIADQLRRHV